MKSSQTRESWIFTFMNTDISNSTDIHAEVPATKDTRPSSFYELGFLPIDDPITHWKQKFPITMLKVGRMLTAKTLVAREVTTVRLSRFMARHKDELPGYYTPKQIHEQLHDQGGEILGGGIHIEWQELYHDTRRQIPRYHFTFSRILRPEELIVKPQPFNERVRTQAG